MLIIQAFRFAVLYAIYLNSRYYECQRVRAYALFGELNINIEATGYFNFNFVADNFRLIFNLHLRNDTPNSETILISNGAENSHFSKKIEFEIIAIVTYN